MKKVLSLALSLLLTLSLLSPIVVTAADSDNSTTSGMVINKTAMANTDGSYTITLEAYGTGDKVTTTVTNEKPTDIVLVLDQSGSMSSSIGSVSFDEYGNSRGEGTTNADHFARRHNGGSGNLYHKVGEKYYSVSITTTEGDKSRVNVPSSTNNSSYYSYYQSGTQLYALINGAEWPVTIQREKTGYILVDYNYTYVANGNTIATSNGRNGTPNFNTDDGALYYYSVETVYSYTYTDANGSQPIGESSGADTEFPTKLYERVVSSSGTSKRQALINAVNLFMNNVSTKAKGANGIAGDADDVDHRVAVVGFASTGSRYTNTELLSTSSVVNYANAANSNYKDALVSVNDNNGNLNSRLTNAVSRLDASGDTYLQYGMDMANKIFAQYPIAEGDTTGRQRVVIVFTDGYPAPSGTDNFNYTMADAAISNAFTTKNSYDATVYTVAVLADADPQTSIVDGYSYGGLGTQEQTVASNRYMHYVSSNYPSATSLSAGGTLNPKANPFNGGDSYYLVAADSDTLNNIFQKISDNIESGGSSTKLSSETVIKDIISPAFALPEGATADDITLESYHCTGKNGDDFTWEKNADAMGAAATVNGDQVSVTGFDFAANYVGQVIENGTVTGYRGDKLVISFTVSPKTGFLGGNDVYTNTSAGVYENANATEPVITFNRPQVNVPIGDVSVTAAEKNVYLLGGVSADQIKAGLTTTVGEGENAITINLDPTVENYGLEPWQTEYVNITVSITDKSGNAVPDLANLTSNAEYEVSVTVSPKTDGSKGDGTPATAKNGSKTGKVNVFTPVVTFQDSELNLRDIPKYADENYVSVVWEHTADVEGQPVTVKSTEVSMTGNEPTLTYIYDPISGGTLTAEREVQVTEVKIDNTDVLPYTTFIRKACTFNGCGHKADSTVTTKDQTKWVNFVVHVNTFDLTITKSGVEAQDAGAPFVFNVSGNGVNMDVVVYGNGSVTIKDLPAGTYTVSEKSGYWRYTCTTGDRTVTPTSIKSVTFENKRTENKWLDDFASATNKFINGTVERS